MNKKSIVIASTNKFKIEEFKLLLPQFNILSLLDFPNIPDVVEDKDTFEGNAEKKAKTISDILNLPVLADDSGLCVEALNGAPGVFSARYAGNHDNAANNEKLLKELENKTNRNAFYITVLALAIPNKPTIFTEGKLNGKIDYKESSTPGFSYDTLFIPENMNKPISEVSIQQKNEFSHRKIAIQNMLPNLTKHL